MIKARVVATAITALLSATALAAAANCSNKVKTVSEGVLTVAGSNYAPFSTHSANGEVGGIDFEIAKRVADDNCLKVVSMPLDSAAVIQAVVSGKADIAIGSWYRTENRAQVLGISAPTYLDPMGVYSKEGTDSVEALIGKQVGTVTGYLWVSELQKLLGDNLKTYPTPIALSQDLEAGRIEIGIDGYNAGAYAQKSAGGYKGLTIKIAQPDERVPASMKPAQTGLLYTKGNETLGKALDEGISKQRSDGSLEKLLTEAGFDAKLLDVGEPALLQ